MTKLLLDEAPLMVIPSLAVSIGLNESIVLQQLHYLTVGKFGKIIEGRRYIYNTLEKWRDTYFPFWTVKTIQRTFKALENAGYVVSMQERSYHRQKLYAIDYEKLDAIRTNCPHPSGQFVHMEEDKLSTSIQREDYTKTTGATAIAAPPSDAQDNNPKDAAGLTDEATDIAGNLPADIRQTSGEMTAEKNRSEMNEKEGGAADATPILSDVSQGATVANATSRDNPILDGSTDYFNRATKPKSQKATITAWKGQQHLKDVCITLCDVTGLSVTKGDSGKWLKGAVALHELGANETILRRVWDEATARDRQFMTHPQAFVERVRSALATQVSTPANTGAALVEWVTTPAGKILRYDGVPYPGESGRQKCVELGIAYEGGN